MDIFLQPVELFVAEANFQIRTILGSCVSITLWHPIQRVGGMSHYLLPSRSGQPGVEALDGRHGDEALELMIKDLKSAGVGHKQCEAKIFGGGDMFPRNEHTRGQHDKGMGIGRKNGEAARELLRLHEIPVLTESLLGIGHRQVIFDVCKGEVWSRQVRPTTPEICAEVMTQGKYRESNQGS